MPKAPIGEHRDTARPEQAYFGRPRPPDHSHNVRQSTASSFACLTRFPWRCRKRAHGGTRADGNRSAKTTSLAGPSVIRCRRFKTRPADCDIVLVILRARMGTVLDVASLKKPDGSPYLSGTEWEFEDAWNANPQPEIMVYRSVNVPAVPLNDPDRKEKQSQYDK